MSKQENDFEKLCEHIFKFSSTHGVGAMVSLLSSILMKMVTEQNQKSDTKTIEMILEGRGTIEFTINESQKLPGGTYRKC